jgi:Xaa-Pro aminopeptidase
MDEKKTNIYSKLFSKDLDANITFGVDNFTYTSQIILPFALNFPDKKIALISTKNGKKNIICPFDWVEAIRDQGWKDDVAFYDENEGVPPKAFAKKLIKIIKDMELTDSKIGIDESRISMELMDILEKDLPKVKWMPTDNVLNEARLIKTQEEIDLIESAANQSELGIITALMHLEGTVDVPGYTVEEFTERVRVHVFEFGGTGVGHVATQFGSDAQMFYSPQRGNVQYGQLARIDITNHLSGYWSNAGRMAVIGNPTQEQETAYQDNLKLKSAAIEMLREGVSCADVFRTVKSVSEEEGISFVESAGVGHGVGVSHFEAPFINESNQTLLQNNMVVALDIYTLGPIGELIHSKDIYKISGGQPTLLSWYKSWDNLYAVTGTRSTH